MAFKEEWSYIISRIKHIRQEKGWSIQRLADEANIDSANMSRIESGKVDNILLSTLYRIAEALEVKLSDLVR